MNAAVTHRMPDRFCPFCGEQATAATGFAGQIERPRPGDLSLCLHCGNVLVFDEQCGVRKPAAGELEAAIADDPLLPSILARMKQAADAVRADLPRPARPPLNS